MFDALIQALRHAHGVRGREAELAARLLLHGRGGERGRRVALAGLRLNRSDAELSGFKIALEGLRLVARPDVEALDLPAVGADKARLEGVVARCRKGRDQRPVFARDELLDFQFPVGHESKRDRLHPAGRAGARQLAPEHGRERETDEIIERAARQIRIDQRAVDLARILHRVDDRLLGDGVEHHALDLLALQRVLFLQHFQHVPGDRLALAVGVGGENQLVGTLDGPGDVGEALGRLRVNLPNHVEIVVRVDRPVFGRQVADVTERGQHFVAGPEIFVDRLGLRG